MVDQAPSLRPLNVLTCLKQVRQPESVFEPRDGRAHWPGPALHKMSNADEFALEEALSIKDSLAGVRVTALTLGPVSSQTILRRALGMGADEAAHLEAEEDSLRPAQVASALAAWAQPHRFDLILCGVMSEDAMGGLVGPWLAESLGLPCATSVVALELDPNATCVRVEREMGGGLKQALELPLPALLTIQSSRRTPRYPTLSNLLKAKKIVLPSMIASDLNLPDAGEEPLGLRLPESRRAGLQLDGSLEEKAARLHAILRERALL